MNTSHIYQVTSGITSAARPEVSLTTLCAWLSVWRNNVRSGRIWSMGPNLNILDNRILIVDNKNIFTYLVWLGISRAIYQKPPIFEVFRSWLDFFPIHECTRENLQTITCVIWPVSSWKTSTNRVTSGRAHQAFRLPLLPREQ